MVPICAKGAGVLILFLRFIVGTFWKGDFWNWYLGSAIAEQRYMMTSRPDPEILNRTRTDSTDKMHRRSKLVQSGEQFKTVGDFSRYLEGHANQPDEFSSRPDFHLGNKMQQIKIPANFDHKSERSSPSKPPFHNAPAPVKKIESKSVRKQFLEGKNMWSEGDLSRYVEPLGNEVPNRYQRSTRGEIAMSESETKGKPSAQVKNRRRAADGDCDARQQQNEMEHRFSQHSADPCDLHSSRQARDAASRRYVNSDYDGEDGEPDPGRRSSGGQHQQQQPFTADFRRPTLLDHASDQQRQTSRNTSSAAQRHASPPATVRPGSPPRRAGSPLRREQAEHADRGRAARRGEKDRKAAEEQGDGGGRYGDPASELTERNLQVRGRRPADRVGRAGGALRGVRDPLSPCGVSTGVAPCRRRGWDAQRLIALRRPPPCKGRAFPAESPSFSRGSFPGRTAFLFAP